MSSIEVIETQCKIISLQEDLIKKLAGPHCQLEWYGREMQKISELKEEIEV